MNVFFVYIENPKYPQELNKCLRDMKAEKFSGGYVIKTSNQPVTIFARLREWIKGGGSFVMIDSTKNMELYFPKRGRHKFLQSHPGLGNIVERFAKEFEDLN